MDIKSLSKGLVKILATDHSAIERALDVAKEAKTHFGVLAAHAPEAKATFEKALAAAQKLDEALTEFKVIMAELSPAKA